MAQSAVGTIMVMFGWLPVGGALGWAFNTIGLDVSDGVAIGLIIVCTALVIYGANKMLDRLWGWSPYD